MVAEHTGTNFIRDTLLGGNDALYTGLSVATTVLGFVGPGGAVNAASRVDDVAGAASGANRADDAASAGPSANRIDDALDNKPTESPAKPDTTCRRRLN